jgi:hypothetical protein
MAMFLAGVPAETIQLIGRWKSQTFMRYIRAQVQQLTRGVVTEMTTNPEFSRSSGETEIDKVVCKEHGQEKEGGRNTRAQIPKPTRDA